MMRYLLFSLLLIYHISIPRAHSQNASPRKPLDFTYLAKNALDPNLVNDYIHSYIGHSGPRPGHLQYDDLLIHFKLRSIKDNMDIIKKTEDEIFKLQKNIDLMETLYEKSKPGFLKQELVYQITSDKLKKTNLEIKVKELEEMMELDKSAIEEKIASLASEKKLKKINYSLLQLNIYHPTSPYLEGKGVYFNEINNQAHHCQVQPSSFINPTTQNDFEKILLKLDFPTFCYLPATISKMRLLAPHEIYPTAYWNNDEIFESSWRIEDALIDLDRPAEDYTPMQYLALINGVSQYIYPIKETSDAETMATNFRDSIILSFYEQMSDEAMARIPENTKESCLLPVLHKEKKRSLRPYKKMAKKNNPFMKTKEQVDKLKKLCELNTETWEYGTFIKTLTPEMVIFSAIKQYSGTPTISTDEFLAKYCLGIYGNTSAFIGRDIPGVLPTGRDQNLGGP